jgi:hypothetical protein
VSLEYSTGGAWTTYTIGTEITLASAGDYIKRAMFELLQASQPLLHCQPRHWRHIAMDMFDGCSSLTTAPALPATTLATGCYRGMFYNCTSLTTAPALPATTLATACYRAMFYNCSKLSSIEVSFTSWGAQTLDWVSSVASSGTFTKPSALAEEYGTSRIPDRLDGNQQIRSYHAKNSLHTYRQRAELGSQIAENTAI